MGAALCLASLALFVCTDSGSSEASDVVLGDGLVIMGAILYAACNVTQEKLLRESSSPSRPYRDIAHNQDQGPLIGIETPTSIKEVQLDDASAKA